MAEESSQIVEGRNLRGYHFMTFGSTRKKDCIPGYMVFLKDRISVGTTMGKSQGIYQEPKDRGFPKDAKMSKRAGRRKRKCQENVVGVVGMLSKEKFFVGVGIQCVNFTTNGVANISLVIEERRKPHIHQISQLKNLNLIGDGPQLLRWASFCF